MSFHTVTVYSRTTTRIDWMVDIKVCCRGLPRHDLDTIHHFIPNSATDAVVTLEQLRHPLGIRGACKPWSKWVTEGADCQPHGSFVLCHSSEGYCASRLCARRELCSSAPRELPLRQWRMKGNCRAGRFGYQVRLAVQRITAILSSVFLSCTAVSAFSSPTKK